MHSLRGRDFLSIGDITPAELAQILSTAHAQKRAWAREERNTPLAGKSIALIFQKPSMRTRVSFEIACSRLGAHPIVMSGNDSAFSRSETVHDTTKVLERYCDAIVMRTFAQSMVEEIAQITRVPVINALTDDHHPCQGLADLLTIEEHLGELEGVRIAYVGDGNNMAHTYLLGGALAGMHVSIACPEGFEPLESVVKQARSIAEETGATISLTHDPVAAVWTPPTSSSPTPGHPWARRTSTPSGWLRSSRFQVDAITHVARRRRRDLPALPTGAPRRGGHRRSHRRPVLGRLRRGREPPARTEGAALTASRLAFARPRTGDRDTHMRKRLERQDAIRRIVRNERVKTQRTLVDLLKAQGYVCTQATVSRDITEMGLRSCRRASTSSPRTCTFSAWSPTSSST